MEPEIAHSFLLHLLITLLSGYLSVLLFWWWKKLRVATNIYILTCFLMVGVCLSSLGASLRYFMGDANDDFLLYLWWWPYRLYPLLFSLVSYAYFVSKKIFFENRFTKKPKSKRWSD